MRMLAIAVVLAGSTAFTQIAPTPVAPSAKSRDVKSLPDHARPIFVSAQRAQIWLKHMNKPDGRFMYGLQPALDVVLEGDNFASQAGAAFALARASRYFRDDRGTTIARQAALSLLLETVIDKDNGYRTTAAPPQALNRLAALGLLVNAIHELAQPGKDLLEQSDQLGIYLHKQQRADGSLTVEGKTGIDESDVASVGWALQAVARSHRQMPAAWKLDLLRKARHHYAQMWSAGKSINIAATHTPAYAEAYVLTKEPAFAETVFAMNDWLFGLQHRENFDPARKHWIGGFPRYRQGKEVPGAPDIGSSLAAQSLADACRVAKVAGDLPRLQRYERALVLNTYFLMSLQYSPSNTSHFAEKYLPRLVGGFHASHQDGNLRVDYTQHALSAMVQYLENVLD